MPSTRACTTGSEPELAWLAPLLLAAVLACLASLCATRIIDYDVWWHLRTGRWIVENAAVPRGDVFSYTIAGRAWVPFEWLSQVLLYAAYAAGGLGGLLALKTAVMLSTFVCMACYAQTRRAAAAPVVAVALALAVWGARTAFAERPQIFTYLLTALYLLILKKADDRPGLLATLPVLQALWANLHGGASVVGLALLGIWSVGARRRRRLWLAGAACAVASLVNPSGWSVYAHLLRTLSFGARASITEWAPLQFSRALAPVWLPLLALDAAAAAAWVANPSHLAGEGLLWLAAVALPGQGLRFAPQAALIAAQIAVGNLPPLLEAWRPRRGTLAASAAAAFAIICLGTWWMQTRAFPGLFIPGLGVAHDARRAIGFMKKSKLTGNIFNSYEFGGQLLWWAPGRPVFVDGRSLEYGADFIRDAINWFKPTVWARLQARYRFQIALIQNGPDYLCGVLDGDPRWRLVYWDDAALVYVRSDGENAGAARQGFRLLEPNQTDFYYLESAISGFGSAAAVLGEADRSISMAPGDLNPRLLKAYLLRRLRKPQEALSEAERAVKLAPERAEPYYEGALCLMALGRFDEARTRYAESLRAARRFGNNVIEALSLDGLAGIDFRRGDIVSAEAFWRRALKLDPKDIVARRGLAAMERARSQWRSRLWRALPTARPRSCCLSTDVLRTTCIDNLMS